MTYIMVLTPVEQVIQSQVKVAYVSIKYMVVSIKRKFRTPDRKIYELINLSNDFNLINKMNTLFQWFMYLIFQPLTKDKTVTNMLYCFCVTNHVKRRDI